MPCLTSGFIWRNGPGRVEIENIGAYAALRLDVDEHALVRALGRPGTRPRWIEPLMLAALA